MSAEGLVGPKGRPLVGNLLQVGRDQLGALTRWGRQFGDLIPLQYGRRRVLLVNHPALVEQVLQTQHRQFHKGYFYRLLRPLLGDGLLTSEGDFWLRQRRLAQPAFHRERIAAYATTMVGYAQEMLADWQDGAIRDVHADVTRLTLRVVGKTLFDADLAHEAAGAGRALTTGLEALERQMSGPEFLLPARIPTPNRLRLSRAVMRLDAIVFRLIAERRASGQDRGDLLSAFLHVHDEDGSRMTDRQLRDECMTIVLAGHETTALALTWTWWLVGQHPHEWDRVQDEVARVLGRRLPGVADVPRLTYLDAVLRETMRLYPPIYGIGREASAPCTLGGHTFPPGTSVYLVQWVTQRDPRFFARPEAFEPGRWLDGSLGKLPHGAYFPFGSGPRKCLGESFAMMEAVLVLATVAQQWRLAAVPGHTVQLVPALTVRPKGGLADDPAACAGGLARVPGSAENSGGQPTRPPVLCRRIAPPLAHRHILSPTWGCEENAAGRRREGYHLSAGSTAATGATWWSRGPPGECDSLPPTSRSARARRQGRRRWSRRTGSGLGRVAEGRRRPARPRGRYPPRQCSGRRATRPAH